MKKFISIILLFFIWSINGIAGNATENNSHFLVFSDIHFDPFNSCNDQVPCPLIQKLQQSDVSKWSALLSTDSSMPNYRQNTNYFLLMSSLNAAQKIAAENQVQFVLILGDFLGHDLRSLYKKYTLEKSFSSYQNFIRKIITFLVQKISATFPNTDVYFIIGNNDTYYSDYVIRPRGPFLQFFANSSAGLIKNKLNRAAFLKEFPKAGYYAVNMPSPSSLRLIVLNSVLFSRNARGKGVEAAAEDQLQWLDKQLQAARDNHQKVFLAMHIPMSIDIYASMRLPVFRLIELWQPKYFEQYREELEKYAPEIAGIFTGHLHADWFQILRFEKLNEIPFFGNPALSPVYGTTPGFKIYSYSNNPIHINDFVIYYFYPLRNDGRWQTEHEYMISIEN